MPQFGATQNFTPFHGGTPDFQGFGGSKFEIASSPFASGNSIQMGGAPGGAGTPGPPVGMIVSKVARLGLAGFQLANSLSAASDHKKAAIAQANQARIIAIENNQDELRQIRIAHKRTDSTIRAQASAGGFSGGSASTLKIRSQQASDALLMKIQSNKQLDRTLAEIQRQESAARKAARGMKTKAITGAISSTLGILGG